jgi:hypothetical protein
MSTPILLLLSGILIGTGVTLVWRDLTRKKRDAFILRREPEMATEQEPEVEITFATRAPEPPKSNAQPAIQLRAGAEKRSSPLAEQWAALQPAIAAAVEQVNRVLAPAGVGIGPPGEPSWSLSRGDYGVYRRVLIGAESKAWLRLELGNERQLHAGLKAHEESLAAINASSSLPASGLTTGKVADLLSEVLKPTASFAVIASGGDPKRKAGDSAWQAVDAVVSAALQAANGALAQAGTRFVPIDGPAWDPQTRRHRLVVAIEVFRNNVARMHIERVGEEMEVAVGVPDARLADLARRERVAVHGLTTHTLAELIASCAWPAISRFRSARGRPGVDARG